jgi:Holliday junction resolvase RusA-like endonuclease
MPTTVFVVEGKPITQGSMVAVYNRKTGRASVRHTQSLPLMKWRSAIQKAAIEAGALPHTTAIACTMVFGMPRPKSHYARSGELHPQFQNAIPSHADLDKLVRAVLDALTGVCYVDDRQVVDLHAIRLYGTQSMVEVRTIDKESAARLAQSTQAHIGKGQLPLPLLRE